MSKAVAVTRPQLYMAAWNPTRKSKPRQQRLDLPVQCSKLRD